MDAFSANVVVNIGIPVSKPSFWWGIYASPWPAGYV
jgi:hypothetical protein